MRVFVYYNLHRKVWSVKALEGEKKGRVIAHRDTVVLRNPKPRVSQAGRVRVLKEKRKNVHAGLVGEWMKYAVDFERDEGLWDEITYNPYKYSSFVYKDDEKEFDTSEAAWMENRRVFVL